MKFCIVLVIVIVVVNVAVDAMAKWKTTDKIQPTDSQAFTQRLNNYERYKRHKLQKYRRHSGPQKRIACICIGKPITSSPFVTSLSEPVVNTPATAAATSAPVIASTVTPATVTTIGATTSATTASTMPVTTLGPGMSQLYQSIQSQFPYHRFEQQIDRIQLPANVRILFCSS